MGYGSTQIPPFLRGVVIERCQRACHYCGRRGQTRPLRAQLRGEDVPSWVALREVAL